MGKLVYGMLQSIDGYFAGMETGPQLPTPGAGLFSHFINQVSSLGGSLYGRRMYEVMRYWDDDQTEWGEMERDFAAAWRAQPKWVASSSLNSVGNNAMLIQEDLEPIVRRLKVEIDGEIDVTGPELAGNLTRMGLIDEYNLYLCPYVLGGGKPYFAGARPPLRFVAADDLGENVVRLKYVPA